MSCVLSSYIRVWQSLMVDINWQGISWDWSIIASDLLSHVSLWWTYDPCEVSPVSCSDCWRWAATLPQPGKEEQVDGCFWPSCPFLSLCQAQDIALPWLILCIFLFLFCVSYINKHALSFTCFFCHFPHTLLSSLQAQTPSVLSFLTLTSSYFSP